MDPQKPRRPERRGEGERPRRARASDRQRTTASVPETKPPTPQTAPQEPVIPAVPLLQVPNPRRLDAICLLLILLATLIFYAPALFTGKTLLPADIVPLMPPWSETSRERFPEFRATQNQMLGPIFEYYSWRYYARDRIRQGEIPLWSPYELGGNVLLANSQSAVLYPPNLLLYLFPLPVGINLVTFLHTLLTGWMMYGLLRLLRMHPSASLTGAYVWMFCALQIVWMEFQTPTAALCWLPGILAAWELGVKRESWRWRVFGSGSGIMMSLVAGHLHFAFYVLLAFVVYALYRTLSEMFEQGRGRAIWRQAAKPVGLMCAALVFGIALSMATMLPVLEMGSMNFRGVKDYPSSVALRLPPENLLTLFMPNLFGNPRDAIVVAEDGRLTVGNGYTGKFEYIEYAHYLGIPALILSLAGILLSLRIRLRQRGGAEGASSGAFGSGFFFALAVLGLLLAMGTPICSFFFYLVPGYKQFNATARALSLFCFGMSGMAAVGLHLLMISLADAEREKKIAFRLLMAASFVVLLAGLTAFPGMGLVWQQLFTDQWYGYLMAGMKNMLAFGALTAAAIFALQRTAKRSDIRTGSAVRWQPGLILWTLPLLCVADLWTWGYRFNPVTDPAMLYYPTVVSDFLRATFPDRVLSQENPTRGIKSFIVPNYNVVVGYREVQGANSLHTRRYHELMEKMFLYEDRTGRSAFPDPNTVRIFWRWHPVLDMLNVRYFTTEKDWMSTNSAVARVLHAEMAVWKTPSPWGRAWMAGRAEPFPGVEEMVRAMGERYYRSPREETCGSVYLETPPPPMDPQAGEGTVEITRFTPHRIVAESRSPAAGLAVFSETFFPGWRARVNGRPAEILTANYILRAVPTPAGDSQIELVYDPASFRFGLYLTCLSLAVMLAFTTYRLTRRKPQ